MNLMARYRKLAFWSKLGVWGAVASIVGLGPVLWPSSPQQSKEAKGSHSVVQNISQSPHSVNVAAETVVFGEPPMPEDKLREGFRSVLKQSIQP